MKQKKLRLYLDTSVFGGCFDEEFAEDSERLMAYIHQGKMELLVSAMVLEELEPAPEPVRNLFNAIPSSNMRRLELNDEIEELSKAYLAAEIVSEKWIEDTLHVACATYYRADAIVSWNFKHIVRLDKMKAYNLVNVENGYGPLSIVSPKEVQLGEEEF